MKACDVLYDKIAYFIEIQLVQILSAAESFGLFNILVFSLFGFFVKGKPPRKMNVIKIDVSKVVEICA